MILLYVLAHPVIIVYPIFVMLVASLVFLSICTLLTEGVVKFGACLAIMALIAEDMWRVHSILFDIMRSLG